MRERHNDDPDDIESRFKIRKRVKNKLDCLIFKMLSIRHMKPTLNKQQSNSIRAKLFV